MEVFFLLSWKNVVCFLLHQSNLHKCISFPANNIILLFSFCPDVTTDSMSLLHIEQLQHFWILFKHVSGCISPITSFSQIVAHFTHYFHVSHIAFLISWSQASVSMLQSRSLLHKEAAALSFGHFVKFKNLKLVFKSVIILVSPLLSALWLHPQAMEAEHSRSWGHL